MSGSDAAMTAVYIVRAVITVYALFITFKCNKGFSFGGFLMALFFSEIYLVYKFAVSRKCFRRSSKQGGYRKLRKRYSSRTKRRKRKR